MRKIVFYLIAITLMICWFLGRAYAELSSADKDFLVQCQVLQSDMDIIPKLLQEVQRDLSALIATKDCKKMDPFKITRDYYRQIKPKTRPPRAPSGFTADYLTDDEFSHYNDLLRISPWDQDRK